MGISATCATEHLHRTAAELVDGRRPTPGVKVDTGTWPLAGAPGELITEGLDGLSFRLAAHAERGAGFATWRAVHTLGDRLPSEWALRANAHAMARFARACQDVGMVPVVEPQVRLDGAHSQHECAGATVSVLLHVSRALADASVDLAATVLSPNMVVPGSRSPRRCTPEAVARLTIDTLLATVPEQIAGIAFLPGGQGSLTANLAAMRTFSTPWPLTRAFEDGERRLALVR